MTRYYNSIWDFAYDWSDDYPTPILRDKYGTKKEKDAYEFMLHSKEKIDVTVRVNNKEFDPDFLYSYEGTLKNLAAHIAVVEKNIREAGYDPDKCRLSITPDYEGSYYSLVLVREETDDEYDQRQRWLVKFKEADIIRKSKAEKAKATREANKIKNQQEKLEKEKKKLEELQKRVKEMENGASSKKSSS